MKLRCALFQDFQIPLFADVLTLGVESPSQTLAPGVVFTATAGLKYKKYISAVRSRRVVVVDSNVQRIVLATEETTVTQVSHRPIKCQCRLWSQRGTKINGSHHGDNPLLRPTGIQIATKRCATLEAMAPTNIKTVHQTSLLHIESNLDRLGLLSPTHDQRSQQQIGQIALQPVLMNKSKFLKATHCTKLGN